MGLEKNHSTTHALIDLYDKILSTLDRKEHAVGVFLDLSKAFHTVNHKILFDKLYHYGICGLALEWVRPVGVLPYMGYIGMCGPKGYGFSAVLVINWVSILAILPPFGS